MLEFKTREQCEHFHMTAFGISCATCERSDKECQWNRRDEPTVVVRPPDGPLIPSAKSRRPVLQKTG